MEEYVPPATTTQSWHVFGAVLCMIRRSVSGRKLMSKLYLLLDNGRLVGRTISNLLTVHHNGRYFSVLSCRYADPNKSFYTPKGIEFSCSNTPEYSRSFHSAKRRSRRRHHHHRHHHHQYVDLYKYDAEAIAKAFETLNAEIDAGVVTEAAKELRVMGSPLIVKEEVVEGDGYVDKEAEEFIQGFYEQLRLQQLAAVTPEHIYRG